MTPRRRPVSTFLVLALLFALLPVGAYGQDATPMAGPLPEGVTIVANGLDNPRNFTWDDSGTLYVAIAGIGGPTMGDIGGSPSGLTGGPTAAVVTLADGCPTVVADGLPSSVWEGVGWVWGTADVAILDGQLYELMSGGGSDYGNFDSPAGIYAVNDDGSTTLVANFSTWSRDNMPAFVPPDFNADGTLNDMFVGDGVFWAVDAVSGRIMTVTPDGEITLFKDYSADHPVPTGIVPDGQGGLYVSNLTAIPYPVGAAKVVNIAADGTVEDAWTGLTAVTGLAMGPDGALYATEMSSVASEEDPFLTPDTGRVVRQSGPDSLEEVVTDLPFPASLGFGADDALYIGLPAFGTGVGQGQGAILRVDPAATPVSLAGVDLSTPTCAAAAAAAAPADAASSGEADAAAPAETQLLEVSLTGETMGDAESIGITRATFDPGASEQTVAGSGPYVLFVEDGLLSVTPADASSLTVVRAGGASGEPETTDGGEVVLEAGDALVMPAGSTAEIRNASEAPAAALALLAAADASSQSEGGVEQSSLANQQAVAAAPASLTLSQATIPAGGRLDFPAAPMQTVAAAPDPRQAMLLSGRMEGGATNRADEPVEIYVLSIEPAG